MKAEWTLRPDDAKAPKDASEGGIAGVSEVPLPSLIPRNQESAFEHYLCRLANVGHRQKSYLTIGTGRILNQIKFRLSDVLEEGSGSS